MKNQYFGDINDYKKYGLLRQLTRMDGLSLAVCWMLTPSDGGTDGRFTRYLTQPEVWRAYDPDLFDALHMAVYVQGQRDVQQVITHNLLPNACFYVKPLSESAQERGAYFASFWTMAQGCDVAFFDPDNGMQVKSCPYGRKGSAKYLYWYELKQTVARGHAVLVYQPFPRVKRDHFMRNMAHEMLLQTQTETVYAFRTARVVFFCLPGTLSSATVAMLALRVADVWHSQIIVQKFPRRLR